MTAAEWLSQGQAVLRPGQAPARSPGEGTPGEDADHGRADRFVPVGLTVPFRAGAVSGELCLMSFAQTGSGARFIAAWQVHSPSLEVQLSHHYPGLIPFDEFTVTDDRGARYQLDLSPGSDVAWPNHDQAEPGAAGDHPLARRRPAVPAGGPGRSRRRGPVRAMRRRSASATPSSARASTCW